MGNKESGPAANGPPPPRAQARPGGGGSVASAIGVQKTAMANLDKKMQQLELMIDQERKLAKQCLGAKTDKSINQAKAKRHLMKAKMYQKRIDKFMGMRNNIEQLHSTLEDTAINKDVAGAVFVARDELKQAQKDLDPDAVAEVQDDIAELQQSAEEAGNILAQSNSDPGLELDAENDMEELMKELELEGGEAEEEVPAVKTKKPAPKIPSLPVAPTTKVVMKTEQDEEEAQLEALMRDMN